MKKLHLFFLISIVPILGFSQSNNLIFTTATWVDSELSPIQFERLQKLRSNYTENETYKISFNDLRTIQVDGEIEVRIPNDECAEVVFTAQDVRFLNDDSYYWFGKIKQTEPIIEDDCECNDGYIILIKRFDEIFGTIQLETRTYIIEALSGNKNVIVREPDEWTENKICGVDDSNRIFDPNDNPEFSTRDAGNCDVSVLFVYTESAGELLNSPENTAERILSITNQALRNSEIYSSDLELKLVGVEEVSDIDEENRNSNQVLKDLTFHSQQTENLRNQLGADIVLLFVNSFIADFDNVLGTAWVGPSPNHAHGVFRAIGSGTTPAHEIAHIFGCRHEPCSALSAGQNCNDPEIRPQQAHSFTYEKGCLFWKETVEQHTIVFSYGGDDRFLQYSNPYVKIKGQPTGIENERDNAKWLKDHACEVASFRNSNDPFTAKIISHSSNQGCDSEPIMLFEGIEGGCPGQYSWKWYKSYDGVNYSYIPGSDNQDLQAYFEGNPGDNTYYKLEATSSCGEISYDFKILHVVCIDYYSLTSTSDLSPGEKLKVFPNPITDGNFGFDFSVSYKSIVSFQIIDLNGAIIIEENLGTLEAGQYSFRTTLPEISPNLLLLKLDKGHEIETTQIFVYD